LYVYQVFGTADRNVSIVDLNNPGVVKSVSVEQRKRSLDVGTEPCELYSRKNLP
jgi:hypothetical protein